MYWYGNSVICETMDLNLDPNSKVKLTENEISLSSGPWPAMYISNNILDIAIWVLISSHL